ncbi:UBP1-associated protein 2C-like [Macadamia integrifolia]|uniref:UBP1-associated protein 2C-like n=1 Tax=Macadamia integrifolia TaxID=60698 RepID=UPI001C4F97BE|nr:UBP1-associated protein 2C-like [Macadamia integrifolia]XP_042510616.1 UBP1-associated protein 2C-like [Macadamia integrifolia]XP_042510618.1 UBP1-associated protein 2C-like [Macadamia integrifolia]XP_042510619.1 UBP1-associated protein 2C-like [Macadamia integrifolia]XP_042510620.1 UBP1-associated protein 2C-like [Macadamia integrifolia]
MDSVTKKRKADENGEAGSGTRLTPEDTRKIIEPFTQEQLLQILQDAAFHHLDVLDAVRAIADRDPTQRKLFIRGLGWDTTTEGLRNLFSQYGDLEEAIVILDKVTGKSKGYGFVTFKHIDGALLALKEPSKKIDGRMTVTQLAAAGNSGPTGNQPSAGDALMRKIYVGNVPQDMPADRLLAHFLSYGEIEEGPLGFDKQTGKSKGFALFVYKTAEAAKASLVDATKNIDGHQLICKLAIEGKKGKTGQAVVGAGGVHAPTGVPGEIAGDGLGVPPPTSMPSTFTSQYGGPPAGLSSYGGFSGVHQGPPPFGGHHHNNLNSPLQPSIGASGLSAVGSQVPSSLGATGGYGAGLSGGPYGASQYGGPTSGGYGGLGGGGSSLYRLPVSSVGMPSGNYPESGHYGLSSAYPSQHHPPAGTSPVPRLPPGALYQSMPPY